MIGTAHSIADVLRGVLRNCLRGASCCALLGTLVASPHTARAQQLVGCHVSFVIYNDEAALERLWIHTINDGAFFRFADLKGYTGRRSVRQEANCSPFDTPCAGDKPPLGLAIYHFSNGAGKLLTAVAGAPAGSLDPILQVGVNRPATDPGAFAVAVTTAIDSLGRDIVPQPLVCVEEVVCPGTSLGVVNDVPGACGDPTGDRRVTASDALAALNEAADLPGLGCNGELFTCDTNSDGMVTVVDALNMLNVALGADVSLDCPLPPDCG